MTLRRLLLPATLAILVYLYFRARGETRCDSRKWLPYEDETGFGYREWRCQQPTGHVGDHSGWLDDSAWRDYQPVVGA